MKVYGALENAQTEWFTNAGKPAAATYPYRKIYITDLQQEAISDGSQWVILPSNVAANSFTGLNTFSNALFSATLKATLTTDSTNYGAISSYSNATPIIELTGTNTSISGFTNFASGQILMFVNRTGSTMQVVNEDTGTTAAQRILTGTGASLSLLNNSSILLAYCGDSRWHVIGGSGGSSAGGAKNYFSQSLANPTFESNAISPWTLFTTTLSGGVPTSITASATQMAFAPTATTPLMGTYSGQLVKSAANAQGQGIISGILTIDREDLGKVMYGSFAYEVVSGAANFDASGTSTQSLEIWIYNITGNYWIQPQGYRGINQTSGPGKVIFSFQTDSTAANNTYKVVIFTAQTAATAYTINVDDFQVGPAAILTGYSGYDLRDTGQTVSALTGATTSAPTFGTRTVDKVLEGRAGDIGRYRYMLKYTSAGSAGTGDYLFSLPLGRQFDSSKVTFYTTLEGTGDWTTNGCNMGTAVGDFQAGAEFIGTIVPYDATRFRVAIIQVSGATPAGAYICSGTFAPVGTSGSWAFEFEAPILGWSSNTQTSDSTDNRICGMRYNCGVATQSISSGVSTTFTNFGTKEFDTHNAFNPATGLFTVPISGYYRVSGSLAFGVNATGSRQVFIRKNGSTIANLGTVLGNASNPVIMQGATNIQCVAGDTLSMGLFQNSGGAISTSGAAAENWFALERISGPTTISATELVAATYGLTTLQTVALNAILKYDTKVLDTHGAYSTSTGLFTAPVSGTYEFSVAWNRSTGGGTYAKLNGTAIVLMGTAGANTFISATYMVSMKAGDTLGMYADTGGDYAASSANGYINRFNIKRVGF